MDEVTSPNTVAQMLLQGLEAVVHYDFAKQSKPAIFFLKTT